MPYKFTNKLEGKRVLVFGGTSGIGFAIVEACVEQGATVIITGSNTPKLEKTLERLTTSYPDVPKSRYIIHACDLADAINQEANVKALFDAVTDGGKTKINHVTFTAGDALNLIAIADITPEAWHKRGTVRLMGSMTVAKLLPKYIEPSADSSLTLTTGVNTTRPMPGFAIAAASGAAIEGLARGLAVDLAPLRVNVVSPGAINTELLANYPESVAEMFAQATTVKRLGRPEDVAEAYLYCIKDGFTSGGVIESNGGRLLV